MLKIFDPTCDHSFYLSHQNESENIHLFLIFCKKVYFHTHCTVAVRAWSSIWGGGQGIGRPGERGRDKGARGRDKGARGRDKGDKCGKGESGDNQKKHCFK